MTPAAPRPWHRSGAAALLVLTALASISACGAGAEEIESRIARIEAGLIPQPGLVLEGEAPRRADLASRLALYKVPGVSVAVIENMDIAWAKGWGCADAETQAPVTPATLFQAASISKPVTAAAALEFAERGLWSLDEDVNGKLLSWTVPENEFTAAAKVTLRHLLSHDAGLTVHGFAGYAVGAETPTLRQILDGEKPANSAPIRVDKAIGSGFRYSGGGYAILQQMMIDAAGKPFPEIMAETVLGPVGMADSTYEQPLPAAKAAAAASAHRANGRKIGGNWHVYPEMAAAGLWTTPSDLARFAIEIIKAWRGEPDRLLSRDTAREMLTLRNERFGLGLMISGTGKDLQFNHSGGNEGFRCYMLAYPERGCGGVVMTNGDLGGDLMVEVLRALADEYGWPDFRPEVKRVVPVDPAGLAGYAGKYFLPGAGEIEVGLEEGRLFVDGIWVPPAGRIRTRLHADPDGGFFSLDMLATVRFDRAENSAATFVLIQNGRERRAERVKPE